MKTLSKAHALPDVNSNKPDPNKPVVVWMGGWVSSFKCWETQLRATFPEFEHEFLETHSVLDSNLPPFTSSLPKGIHPSQGHKPQRIVAAWSLGSLRVHRWMAEGVWPMDIPVLSLCPVFRFVQPGTSGTFGESILLRMEQKLGAARETVLRDFWRRMPKASLMPPEWESQWLEASRQYDDESVLRALQYLRLETAEPATLRSIPARWELIAGAQDRLAPVESLQDELAAHAPHARLTVHPGGHIPFWECPDVVTASLRRLTGKDA